MLALDVILGVGCNKHCGNLKFRQFIKAYKRARLQTKTKIAAVDAVKEVVEFWRKLSPPGRFLAEKKGDGPGQWREVEERQAMKIASFFLLNGGDMKRQKSIDAMRNVRNSLQACQPQQAFQPQQARCSGVGEDIFGPGTRSQDGRVISAQGQAPDITSSLEPMPIGAVSSSMPWDGGPSKLTQSYQEPAKTNFQDSDQDFAPLDFNPLPFKPNNEGYDIDDFEPLPTNFNDNFSSGQQNTCSLGPVDVSANAQFGGASDHVQVSVNMVVNTMPQGYPRESAVNTVTNIQIGTGSFNDDRRTQHDGFFKSAVGDGFQGQNFQLTTDTANGFIQISAQSNPTDGVSSNTMIGQGNNYGFNNNAGNDMMGSSGLHMANGGMSSNSNSVNCERRNINLSISNNNVGASGGNDGASKSSLTWKKSEVANSVPCAASLVGSLFDDW